MGTGDRSYNTLEERRLAIFVAAANLSRHHNMLLLTQKFVDLSLGQTALSHCLFPLFGILPNVPSAEARVSES